MSVEIWPFRFLRDGFKEYLESATAQTTFRGGRRVRQQVHAMGELVARGSVLLHPGGRDWNEFETFVENKDGAYDDFLYKRQKPGAAVHTDSFDPDPAQVDFVLTRRYIDVSKIVVIKGTTQQVLGPDYTVKNTAGGAYVLGDAGCMIRFAVAPDPSAVTVRYEYYFPVTFEVDDTMDSMDPIAPDVVTPTQSVVHIKSVLLRETGPGFHLEDPPNA